MVLCVAPDARSRRYAREQISAYIRNSGSSSTPQTQFAKSWLVAIGTAMIVTKPTDAVREKHTVPLGRIRAAELAIPASLVLRSVDAVQWPSSNRISVSEIQ